MLLQLVSSGRRIFMCWVGWVPTFQGSTSHLLLSRPEPCVQLDHASSRMPGDREREEERAGSFVWTRERKQNRLHLSDVNQALRHGMRKIRLFIICCCFVGSSCILAVTSRTDAAKAEFSCRCLQQQETQQRTLVKASIKLRAAMSKSPEVRLQRKGFFPEA